PGIYNLTIFLWHQHRPYLRNVSRRNIGWIIGVLNNRSDKLVPGAIHIAVKLRLSADHVSTIDFPCEDRWNERAGDMIRNIGKRFVHRPVTEVMPNLPVKSGRDHEAPPYRTVGSS